MKIKIELELDTIEDAKEIEELLEIITNINSAKQEKNNKEKR